MKRRILRYVPTILLIYSLLFVSCGKDSLESPLSKKLDYEDIKTVEVLNSVLHSTYRFMASDTYYGRYAILLGEVRSENCVANLSSEPYPLMEEYNTGMYLNVQDYSIQNLWTNMYRAIAAANAVIAKEHAPLEGDPAILRTTVGQAYGLRALIHFDLLRFFGAEHAGSAVTGIPYVTSYPPKTLTPARTSVLDIKVQLYADIEQALKLLMPASTAGDPEKVYLSYYAVHHLRARIALWFQEPDKALESIKIVEESAFYRILKKDEYIASWQKKLNPNSIFELAITEEVMNNQLGLAQMYNGELLGDISATDYLKACFEPTDIRGSDKMIGENLLLKANKKRAKKELATYLANLGKYADFVHNTDNIVVMRYEELVLLKAEALYRKGDLANALIELNRITSERGASPYAVVSEKEILLERQRELCFEGFRFDDLCRFRKSADPACAIDLPNLFKLAYQYGTKQFTLPIPDQEIRSNPMLKQTDNY